MNWLLRSSSSDISPTDIYDIFALSLIPPRENLGDYEKLINFESEILKDKFVSIFMSLMRSQIKKYLGREDRYDPDQMDFLDTHESADAPSLERMFDSATFRSERHRTYSPEDIYNTRWAEVARSVGKLANSSGFREIVLNLAGQGGLLNLIHNTETSILDKLPGGMRLLAALDECHSAEPRQIISKANPDVRNILRAIL